MSENEVVPGEAKLKPVIKPRKKFIPKKKVFKSDKKMEFRVRHIRLTSLETAKLILQTIVDYQSDLAEKPMDDPDKEFIDQEKVERFFAKLAKKYSACPTRNLGGDLDWIHNHEVDSEASLIDTQIKAEIEGSVLTEELVEDIMKCERNKILGPIKSALGFHVVLVCESRFHVASKDDTSQRSVVDDVHGNAERMFCRMPGISNMI